MSKDGTALALEDLRQLSAAGEIDTVLVMFSDLYGRSMGKRFDVDFFLEVAEEGSHACDYLLTADIEMEPVVGYDFANWELGYGDVHLLPDLGTLRRAAWLEKSALVLCDVAKGENRALVSQAPRSLLRSQVDAFRERGLEVKAASELEFYVYETSYREAAEQGYSALRPLGWYLEDYHMQHGSRQERLVGPLRRHLRDSGVPVETSKGEWGLGQHELNIRYAEVLEMADRHTIYKHCAKDTADALDLSVSFMAKVSEKGAGSSCHVHLSLWEGDQNVFAGSDALGAIRCSDTFRHFLGGWLQHAPEMMAFYAPNVNSYKRYRAGSWAPTRLAWSHDNRTAAFRVVGAGPSLRIECRIPGADCNPYLVYAAALASGLDGIEQRIEPPACFAGDVYAADALPALPASLAESVQRLEASEFARRAFGEPAIRHYLHFFRTEIDAFEGVVTDWERKRYFERI